MIVVPKEAAGAMIAHANAIEPYECCGLLAIERNRIVAFYPTRTELGTASAVRYTIRREDLLKYVRLIEDSDREMGIFHSHTHSEAYPSPTDITNAAFYPEAHYFIVTLADRSRPGIRAFRIVNGIVTEEDLAMETIANDPDVVTLTPEQRDGLFAHARAEAPNECCGLLAIAGRRVVEIQPGRNLQPSPVFYLMDPQDQLTVGRRVEAAGQELAYYHSHLQSPAYPSATDLELASDPGAIYFIISLRDPAAPDLRAYRIDFTLDWPVRHFRELTLRVADEPTTARTGGNRIG